MKNYIIKGLKLLVLSSIYIALSFIYYDLLYESEIAMNFGILIGLGFLALWFYFGYHYYLGFKGGLLVGTIGALFGVYSAILSLSLLYNSPDDAPLWIMIPWSYPLSSLFLFVRIPDLFPNYRDAYSLYLSVLIVILLTALGGYIGKTKRTTSN